MAAENKLILVMEYSTVPEISSELGVRNEKKGKIDWPSLGRE